MDCTERLGFPLPVLLLKVGKIHGKKNIPYWGKLLQPGGKGAEMEMGWAEHDDNAARSPLSPKEGAGSMLSSELISEQIRTCWREELWGKEQQKKDMATDITAKSTKGRRWERLFPSEIRGGE